MGCSYAGFPGSDPKKIRDACIRQELPLDWLGLPYKFTTQVGGSPGEAWLILAKKYLDQIDIESPHDFKIDSGTLTSVATIKNLYFIRARCLTPGFPNDPQSQYLLQLRDRRHFCQNEFYGAMTDRQYNVRAPAGEQDYYEHSLNMSAPWTWQEMLDDMWLDIPLSGACPNLPFSPDGFPENYRFLGVSSWFAFNSVLTRLGCVLVLNPFTDVFTIVQVGETDAFYENALTTYRDKLVYDPLWVESVAGKTPETVRVVFHKFSMHYGTEQTTTPLVDQWSSEPIHFEDIATGVPDAIANTQVVLYDDLSVQIDYDGSILNQTEIDARATERSVDYLRMIEMGMNNQTYRGIIPADGFLPGSQVSAVCWKDTNKGLMTEISRYALPGSGRGLGGMSINEFLNPPNLARATFPNYPDTVQLLIVDDVYGDPEDLLWEGRVAKRHPQTRVFTFDEDCIITPLNDTELQTGSYVLGRLNGVQPDAELPLYQVDDASIVGGELIIREVDLSPSVVATIFEIDADASLAVPSAGVVRLNAASLTTSGVVNMTTQFFMGDKWIVDAVYAIQTTPDQIFTGLQALFDDPDYDYAGGVYSESIATNGLWLGFEPDERAVVLYNGNDGPSYGVRWNDGGGMDTYFGIYAIDDGVDDLRTKPNSRLTIHGGIVVDRVDTTSLRIPPRIDIVDEDDNPYGVVIDVVPGDTDDDPPRFTIKTWPPNDPDGPGGTTIQTTTNGWKVWEGGGDPDTDDPCLKADCGGYDVYNGGNTVTSTGKDPLTGDGYVKTFTSTGGSTNTLSTDGYTLADGSGNTLTTITPSGWTQFDPTGNTVISTSIVNGGGFVNIVGSSGSQVILNGANGFVKLVGPGGGPVLKIGPNGIVAQNATPVADSAITYGADGGGVVIENAKYIDVYIPYAFQILKWTVLCNPTGNIEWELLYSTYTGYDTLASFVGTTKPLIAAATKAQGVPTVADGWKLWFPAGTCFRFKTKDPAVCTFSTITLDIRKGNPALIDALASFWYKAISILGLANTDPIASVPDDTSETGPLVQATGGNKATFRTNQINGRPVWRFDGTNDYFSVANVTLGAFTIFIVQKKTVDGANEAVIEHSANPTANDGCGLSCGVGSAPADSYTFSIVVKRGATVSAKAIGPVVDVNSKSWRILRWRYDGTHAGHTLYGDGANLSLTTSGGFNGDPGTAEVTDTMFVGSRNGASAFLNADQEQIIGFPSWLSDAQCEEIESQIRTVDGL